jgi:hypothetical protein
MKTETYLSDLINMEVDLTLLPPELAVSDHSLETAHRANAVSQMMADYTRRVLEAADEVLKHDGGRNCKRALTGTEEAEILNKVLSAVVKDRERADIELKVITDILARRE